ncbi:MAG: ROK family protein [Terracidiphilus sp.]|jgi:glucokinase
MPALVFDLGGTFLRCAVTRGVSTHCILKQRIETFLDGLSPDEVASRIANRISDYVESFRDSVNKTDPMIVAFPGPVENGRVALSAPTLYGRTNGHLPDLAARLHDRTGRRVHMLNDVSAAAWGLSARTEAQRFLVVTVSSGIGSKLFDRTNPRGVLDDPSFAGEIGHFVVDPSPNALLCDCGGRGHLGAIASGRGVERMARQIRKDESLTNERQIVPAILQGESWALEILGLSMQPLVHTLLGVTMAVGLDKVFIIGGFAQSVGLLYEKLLNDLVVANSRYGVLEERLNNFVELVSADEELCLSGAAYYAAGLGIS